MRSAIKRGWKVSSESIAIQDLSPKTELILFNVVLMVTKDLLMSLKTVLFRPFMASDKSCAALFAECIRAIKRISRIDKSLPFFLNLRGVLNLYVVVTGKLSPICEYNHSY